MTGDLQHSKGNLLHRSAYRSVFNGIELVPASLASYPGLARCSAALTTTWHVIYNKWLGPMGLSFRQSVFNGIELVPAALANYSGLTRRSAARTSTWHIIYNKWLGPTGLAFRQSVFTGIELVPLALASHTRISSPLRVLLPAFSKRLSGSALGPSQ